MAIENTIAMLEGKASSPMRIVTAIKAVPFGALLVQVTPHIAKKWLHNNTMNRAPSNGVIKKYARAMEKGEWKITPDFISFAKDGTLLNGQHRLMAVVESGVTVDMCIATDVEKDSFYVMDRGKTRTYSFALGENRELSQCARLLASKTVKDYVDSDIKEAIDFLRDSHDRLTGSKVKTFSSTGAKLGACLRYIESGGSEYVIDQYSHMINGDVLSMSPLCLSVWKRFMKDSKNGIALVSGGVGQEFMCKAAFEYFDEKKKNNSKINLDALGNDCWSVYKLQVNKSWK